MSEPAAILRETSYNAKLSPIDYAPAKGRSVLPHPIPRAPFVSATVASIEKTCPSSCPFKRVDGVGRGCFADSGFTKRTASRLNEAAARLTSTQVIWQEVDAIDAAFDAGRVPQDGARGGRDLRLHVMGDVTNAGEASTLAGAAERWRARGGGAVWTYTHAWRSVARASWGGISVLASCETPADLRAARRRGYAPALVVDRFPNGGKSWQIGALRAVPCPAEAGERTCAECRLCLDRDLYALRIVIAFAVHGPTRAAHQSLAQAKGEELATIPKRKYVRSGKFAKRPARALPPGVYPANGQPGRYVARITHGSGGAYEHLGTFNSPAEAAAARARRLAGKRALPVVA